MTEDELIEQVASAHRPAGAGELRYHPSWHDLDADGRARAYEAGRQQRALEAALDPAGLSAAAHAVLAKIRATPAP